MKKRTINKTWLLPLSLFLMVFASSSAQAHSDGIIRVKSNHSVATTIDRLQNALDKKGMTIFKRVNHAQGGHRVGIDIRPTELLIFGNPKIGTKLMQCSQEAALDLPQKALAYEDKSGNVWLIYNDPVYMANRHHIDGCKKVVGKFSKALAHFTKIAAQ